MKTFKQRFHDLYVYKMLHGRLYILQKKTKNHVLQLQTTISFTTKLIQSDLRIKLCKCGDGGLKPFSWLRRVQGIYCLYCIRPDVVQLMIVIFRRLASAQTENKQKGLRRLAKWRNNNAGSHTCMMHSHMYAFIGSHTSYASRSMWLKKAHRGTVQGAFNKCNPRFN